MSLLCIHKFCRRHRQITHPAAQPCLSTPRQVQGKGKSDCIEAICNAAWQMACSRHADGMQKNMWTSELFPSQAWLVCSCVASVKILTSCAWILLAPRAAVCKEFVFSLEALEAFDLGASSLSRRRSQENCSRLADNQSPCTRWARWAAMAAMELWINLFPRLRSPHKRICTLATAKSR